MAEQHKTVTVTEKTVTGHHRFDHRIAQNP